jgi:autotransporter adhesin
MIAAETANRASADAALSTRLDGLSFDIRDTGREARAGTASALAAAGLPQASGEGRTMIAGGVGTYRGKTALAIGASHRLQGGTTTFKVGVTYDSEKHVGANGGVGFEF